MATNESPLNSGSGTSSTVVDVQLRCEIPDVIVVQDNTYRLARSVDWITELAKQGVFVNASEHCVRRSGHKEEFNLDDPVLFFQKSFTRENIKKFVAILAMKGKARRGRGRPAGAKSVKRTPFPVVNANRGTTARNRQVQQNETATSSPPRIITEEITGEILLPRIMENLASTRQAEPVAAPSREMRNIATTSAATALMSTCRTDDTQAGDEQGVDEKNICLEYISNHWNNQDTMKMIREVREVKRTNNYGAFLRLLPFTAGMLKDFAIIRFPLNDDLLEQQRLNLRVDNTQQGDEDGITEKTRWFEHVRRYVSNVDILEIRNELEELWRQDKQRGFRRLLPFTTGFIQETFLDVLVNHE